MPLPKKPSPSPSFSRVALEPMNANTAIFADEYKNSRENREANFVFSQIMGIIMNGSNSTFNLQDVFSISKSLPLSFSEIRSRFEAWAEQAILDKKVVVKKGLFPEDGNLYQIIG